MQGLRTIWIYVIKLLNSFKLFHFTIQLGHLSGQMENDRRKLKSWWPEEFLIPKITIQIIVFWIKQKPIFEWYSKMQWKLFQNFFYEKFIQFLVLEKRINVQNGIHQYGVESIKFIYFLERAVSINWIYMCGFSTASYAYLKELLNVMDLFESLNTIEYLSMFLCLYNTV